MHQTYDGQLQSFGELLLASGRLLLSFGRLLQSFGVQQFSFGGDLLSLIDQMLSVGNLLLLLFTCCSSVGGGGLFPFFLLSALGLQQVRPWRTTLGNPGATPLTAHVADEGPGRRSTAGTLVVLSVICASESSVCLRPVITAVVLPLLASASSS